MKLVLFKPVPDVVILALSKLKAFTDDKFNVTPNFKYVFYWVEIIKGDGENAGNQHFLLFSPTMFSKDLFLRGVKSHCFLLKGYKMNLED